MQKEGNKKNDEEHCGITDVKGAKSTRKTKPENGKKYAETLLHVIIHYFAQYILF